MDVEVNVTAVTSPVPAVRTIEPPTPTVPANAPPPRQSSPPVFISILGVVNLVPPTAILPVVLILPAKFKSVPLSVIRLSVRLDPPLPLGIVPEVTEPAKAPE